MAFAHIVLATAVAVLAVSIAADSPVDINRLIHTDRQTAPPSGQKSPSIQIQPPRLPQESTLSQPGGSSDVGDRQVSAGSEAPAGEHNPDLYDEFVPSKNPRYDEFDWVLTKNVLAKNQSNTIISPFLVKLLLSVLAEAAGPNTSTERELQSIWPSIQSNIKTREHYGNIFKSLKKKSSDYDLNLGVRVYVDEFITPGQRYQAITENFYETKVEKLDFSQVRQSAEHINAWCRNITNNFIKEIVTEADVERAVILLLNAIYFNGYWRRPFLENQTVPLQFKTDLRNKVTADFMDLSADFFYMEDRNLDAKIIRLPYKGRKYAMYIALPNTVDGLDEMIRKIDSTSLQRAQWLMDEVEVRVLLPKFKFDNEVHLNNVLKELGIETIFTSKASFPLLARGANVQDRLQVSQVLQKTGINVNEKGSTVYAATQISLTNKFGGDYEFRADHPFLFLIEDESTNTLLFAGKVISPEF